VFIGKTALVTGTTSGIGWGIARSLAAQGANGLSRSADQRPGCWLRRAVFAPRPARQTLGHIGQSGSCGPRRSAPMASRTRGRTRGRCAVAEIDFARDGRRMSSRELRAASLEPRAKPLLELDEMPRVARPGARRRCLQFTCVQFTWMLTHPGGPALARVATSDAVRIHVFPLSMLDSLSQRKRSRVMSLKRILVLTGRPDGSTPAASMCISPSFQTPCHSTLAPGCPGPRHPSHAAVR